MRKHPCPRVGCVKNGSYSMNTSQIAFIETGNGECEGVSPVVWFALLCVKSGWDGSLAQCSPDDGSNYDTQNHTAYNNHYFLLYSVNQHI